MATSTTLTLPPRARVRAPARPRHPGRASTTATASPLATTVINATACTCSSAAERTSAVTDTARDRHRLLELEHQARWPRRNRRRGRNHCHFEA
jgi:hypothetical protein